MLSPLLISQLLVEIWMFQSRKTKMVGYRRPAGKRCRYVNTGNLILEKRKSKGAIRLANCGYTTNIVYFNEDILRKTQDLFAKTRKIKNKRTINIHELQVEGFI
ncbi:hypothetical protein WA026_021881 [Henosepilachna vigintioctopunctata]|uniref:Uncharacterized protein n=1 Tax=Henosepilachna vigintioctopunctata TaxID=420089 RepID=A0AAW1UP00_9CUCU